jgi:hypothetical protein
LGKSWFFKSSHESLQISAKSRLRRIEETRFPDCSAKTAFVPRDIDFLDPSVFVRISIESISTSGTLVDQKEQVAVRYLGGQE